MCRACFQNCNCHIVTRRVFPEYQNNSKILYSMVYRERKRIPHPTNVLANQAFHDTKVRLSLLKTRTFPYPSSEGLKSMKKGQPRLPFSLVKYVYHLFWLLMMFTSITTSAASTFPSPFRSATAKLFLSPSITTFTSSFRSASSTFPSPLRSPLIFRVK